LQHGPQVTEGHLSVLVIDIDESRQDVVLALQDAGFRVIEVLQSDEGLSVVLDSPPRLIIVGEEMPPVDGVDLVPLLRWLTDSPIITLGSGGEIEMVKALVQGADFYLTRPVSPRELMARVRALLRRHGAARGFGEEPLLSC
jgi:DNA-binding response OmpR family regulator